MMNPEIAAPSLDKRIKRQVIGKDHGFFAVCSPGLAPLCKAELTGLDGLQPPEPIASREGVSFQSRLTGCYSANLWSRTATRILMRVLEVAATEFSHFHSKCRKFPWELFLPIDIPIRIQATTHHCRLHHSEALAERLVEAIQARIPRIPRMQADPENRACQRIFIRGIDDRFAISLDTSGDPLYKRGIKQSVGKAPLRETLAASVLKLAGYDGSRFLLDPMCGSGTFSLEAAMIARNVPPGWLRRFSFMHWPGFKQPQWDHLRRKAEGTIRHQHPLPIVASDIDTRLCGTLEETIRSQPFLEGIVVHPADFFHMQPSDFSREPGWIVLNPPYGIRLRESPGIASFHREICSKLSKDFRQWRLAWLSPDEPNLDLSFSRRYRLVSGGIPLTLVVGMIGQ
ncbi:THUMP domain-containing class I SAM-dependent RNA methyltransferase [Desulfatirhabdium butyrativorans]|uniref:THUMP domain-containing class I SAM-dependent RNA methyltransferase n=1 Tax=Desulfatirhabdium butyrativorans TaxID=340467 RepID=UPI0004181467|nr:RNA methyltransferase [Desulfatirhabdium butyrativorans]